MDGSKREKVAMALFRESYTGAVNDDPPFPDRLWATLTEEQRGLWYRKADAAIAAMV